jgi:hypothetical protein
MHRTNSAAPRPTWNTPKLQELGNLRSLVRVGNANGKSFLLSDGSSACGAEAMSNQTGNCPH